MTPYESRRAARIERMRARADRLASEAEAAHEKARAVADRIPMGQPILVGHHSERRHRRDLERMDRSMTRAVDLAAEAKALRMRADHAEDSDAVFSDDPDAAAKLRAQLDEARAAHAQALECNRRLRAGASDAEAAEVFGEDAAAFARRMSIWRSLGHSTLPTSNSAANVRRLEKRIAEIEARAIAPVPAPEQIGEVRIEQADNRVRIVFPGKPDEAVRERLKRAGFRWAPSAGAWQRHASNAAWVAAREAVRA